MIIKRLTLTLAIVFINFSNLLATTIRTVVMKNKETNQRIIFYSDQHTDVCKDEFGKDISMADLDEQQFKHILRKIDENKENLSHRLKILFECGIPKEELGLPMPFLLGKIKKGQCVNADLKEISEDIENRSFHWNEPDTSDLFSFISDNKLVYDYFKEAKNLMQKIEAYSQACIPNQLKRIIDREVRFFKKFLNDAYKELRGICKSKIDFSNEESLKITWAELCIKYGFSPKQLSFLGDSAEKAIEVNVLYQIAMNAKIPTIAIFIGEAHSLNLVKHLKKVGYQVSYDSKINFNGKKIAFIEKEWDKLSNKGVDEIEIATGARAIAISDYDLMFNASSK